MMVGDRTDREDPQVTVSTRVPRSARTKLAVSAAAIAAVVALSGCGAGGVMHDGKVGAQSGSVTVSSSALQDTVKQINSQSTSTTSQVAAADVIPFIVLAPKFDSLARTYNIGISDDQIRANFPKENLSQTTLDAYRANAIYAQSQQQTASEALRAAGQKIMTDSKITVNPRFGSVTSGQAGNANADWLTYQPVNSAELGLPGGHPAN